MEFAHENLYNYIEEYNKSFHFYYFVITSESFSYKAIFVNR